MAAGARQAAFLLAGAQTPFHALHMRSTRFSRLTAGQKKALIFSSAHVPSLQAPYLIFQSLSILFCYP